MGFPDVNIVQRSGGTGRPLPGFDYYSGLMLYGPTPTVTGKWPTYNGTPNIKAQQIFSVSDAEAAGILPYTDNTASTGTWLITTKGNTGDILIVSATISVLGGGTSTVVLATYTAIVGDSTIALQGAAITALINAGTVNHGFSAAFTLSTTITITAPKNQEKYLNTGTPYTFGITGAFVGTLTQNVIAGTASDYALWHYHIAEYFRIFSSGGNIWVGIIAASSSFNELNTLQSASGSKLRQIGIVDVSTATGLAANVIATILGVDTAAKLSSQTQPYQVVYQPNITAVANLGTYPDQNLNVANTVQCVLSQDGLYLGNLLYRNQGRTIGNCGVKLATLALSRVSASDAQITDQNNVSNGQENNTPAFGNGQLSSVVDPSIQLQLNNYNYTFFRTWGDVKVGTYWNDNRCCISNASDYAYMNDNRVIQKIIRIGRQTYVPLVSGELIFNGNLLSNSTLEYFIDEGIKAITASMITGFGATPLISGVTVEIDPTQEVKITNNLAIFITINENGIARSITLNIGYGS